MCVFVCVFVCFEGSLEKEKNLLYIEFIPGTLLNILYYLNQLAQYSYEIYTFILSLQFYG